MAWLTKVEKTANKDEKNDPIFFLAFREFQAATTTAPAAPECCAMLRPPNPMLRQAAHRLRRVLREMAISTGCASETAQQLMNALIHIYILQIGGNEARPQYVQ